MLILAFETSAKAASVALLEDGSLLGEYYQNCGQTHSRTLLKMAEDLLENCGRAPKDVSAVAVAAGPGSFTGVRIGVAAAKGFAWGLDLPCVGVSTLEAMACQAAAFEGYVCCAMDARRSQVYHALFLSENGTLTRCTEDQAISLEDLEKSLKICDRPIIFVGDGAYLCYNTLGSKIPGCRTAPEQMIMQRASGVALAAYRTLLGGAEARGATLTPNYLRLSQAERERAEREKKENQNG
ncbi:MAG: tRNA (adenosine(37)-N6)-threonylcarbamoyltransferase complex dimerization subunit type 1 TsaB [Oscillospiraceae bacterium]|nr:tRNA (adenosine(37)-N6)-threonylcarbamoyltransferase complex dimerization subunit type 1 TsaB [Oscillospiraceae bacterium]